MKLTINPFQFGELIKKSISLDHIFLLKLINENIDIAPLRESVKVALLYQTLIRRGFLNDEGDKLTTLGQEFIVFAESKNEKKLAKKTNDDTEFTKWWQAFPGTDSYEYKRRTFTGCRNLRQNKEECRLKFNKIILEGEYSAKDLISALVYDVTQKKEMSIKTGTNKLTYMQNSLTYLNQRSYEVYIELINTGSKIIESIGGGTEI